MVAGVLDPRKLVFVDECGTHTSLAPLYGYSPKGERLKLSVPRNLGKNTTLLASITLEGMGPSYGGRGLDHQRSFRGLSGAGPPSRSGRRASADHGQAAGTQAEQDERADRGEGLRVCCTCPATPRTTTPSKRLSPRSRKSYAGRVPGLARPSSKRWAKRYPRSASGMPGDSSSTPVTILRVNYFETCCMRTAGSSPLWMSS